MTSTQSLRERLRDKWLAGFWAATLLFSGRYRDYAVARDKMLAEKDEAHEYSEKLREVALIAETHFLLTFGTEHISAVRKAADALDAKDTEIAALRGTISAIVNTVGGTVDGHPTQAINVLQRVRQLVEIERELSQSWIATGLTPNDVSR